MPHQETTKPLRGPSEPQREPNHILDGRHSASAASIPPIASTMYSPYASHLLRHKYALIDLKDWLIDDGPFRSWYDRHPQQLLPPQNDRTTIARKFTSNQLHPPSNFAKGLLLSSYKLSFNSPHFVSPPATPPTSNTMLMLPESNQPCSPTLTDLSTTNST